MFILKNFKLRYILLCKFFSFFIIILRLCNFFFVSLHFCCPVSFLFLILFDMVLFMFWVHESPIFFSSQFAVTFCIENVSRKRNLRADAYYSHKFPYNANFNDFPLNNIFSTNIDGNPLLRRFIIFSTFFKEKIHF